MILRFDPEGTITFNAPDFSEILACLTNEDEHIHLGSVLGSVTVCGKPTEKLILSRENTITCPECVAEIKYRAKHPDAAKEDFGVVTHKQ
jgi:hypothetical protein